MKVLVIGGGGREHAIARKAAESRLVDIVYCAPGNGGTENENRCFNIDIISKEGLLEFAKDNKIDLTIVGPENFLVEGVVDEFKKEGLRIFGPSKEAARLEGSKAFAKSFMKKYGVKTAEYESFEDMEEAKAYLKKCSYPAVIKADGLAAGKGVVICQDIQQANETINDFMVKDILRGSGRKIIIEEYIEGVEASILSITDGKTVLPFISAMDHKALNEGNTGPNTGGMGAVAPNPHVTAEVFENFRKDILEPTLKGIQSEGMDYTGIIFFGIMINNRGVYLLEYNVRMGDPETQAVLPLMKSDFIEIILSAVDGRLLPGIIEWADHFSCCVMAVSKGYPGNYETGHVISGVDKVLENVYISGAKCKNGRLTTSGGRVLCTAATAGTLEEARNKVYSDMSRICFEGLYYRKDIGSKSGIQAGL